MLRRIAEALERIANALEALDFTVQERAQEKDPREEKINKMFTEGLDNLLSYGGKHAE